MVRPPALTYVSDRDPGISRKAYGRHYRYIGPDGHRIVDDRVLERIRLLAIPPAYTKVWICTDPRGHLQATGRDARSRKQYRYHAQWRVLQDAAKFEHMIEF